MRAIDSRYFFLGLIAILILGCATSHQVSKAPTAQQPVAALCRLVGQKDFCVSVTPIPGDVGSDWMAVELKAENRTDSPILLMWNDCSFSKEGGKEGSGFMWAGVAYDQSLQQKEPTSIAPGETIKRIIWPTSNVSYSGPRLGWIHMPLEPGKIRVRLLVKVKEVDVPEEIELDLPPLGSGT